MTAERRRLRPGLGFPVVFDLRDRWRLPRTWSLHTKVTLSTSAALLVVGAIVVGLVERTNPETSAKLSATDQVWAALFQSASARTAGFSTIDIGSMRTSSWLALILLMVIGSGSASTGGGIKVTTFALVIRAALAELRGDETTSMFQRQIPFGLQRQALALMAVAAGTVGTATFLLTLTSPDIALGEVLFEVASAFGTVGVSTGVTEQLDGLGHVVIMVLMFVGRVGPITFGTALMLRPQAKKYKYAQEPLIVG